MWLQYFKPLIDYVISNRNDCKYSQRPLIAVFQIIELAVFPNQLIAVFQIIYCSIIKLIGCSISNHWYGCHFKSLVATILNHTIAPISQIIDCSIDQIIVLQYFEEFYWLSSISQISWLHAGLQNHWQSSISCIDLSIAVCSKSMLIW